MKPAMAWLPAALGALLVASGPGPAPAQPPLGPTVMGRIVWPEHDLSRGQVRIYQDQALTNLVEQFGTGGAGGAFVLLVEPGEYYLMAVVDDNGNEKVDTGDGIGFYGVTKFGADGQKPAPIKVAKDALVADVRIPITATISENGKPQAAADPGTVDVQPPEGPAFVGGALSGVERLELPVFLLVLTVADHAPLQSVRLAPGSTEFRFTAGAGDYHLIAVADVSGDGEFGAGDRVGAYGVADWAKAPPALPPLSLHANDEIGGLEIPLTGRLGEDGVVDPGEGTGSFQLTLDTLPGIVSGAVVYPGAGLKPTQVRLSSDPGMSQPVASIECEPGSGIFTACVNPGTYYLTAIVDENNDGRFGPGDAVGFYGIDDLTATQAPPPVTIGHASLLCGVDIRIVARVTEDKRLAPIPATEAAEETQN